MPTHEILLPRENLSWLIGNCTIDHDNTTADTKQAVTDFFNKKHNTNHLAKEITHWNSLIDWSLELGKSYEEALVINKDYWYNADILFSAKPIPGAAEFLTRAISAGNRIVINSSRPYNQLDMTVEWYKKHIPVVRPENICVGLPDIVTKPDHERQAVTKAWMIRLLKSRMHIDDVPFHSKLILDNTQAYIFLLSNNPELDGYAPGRLFRYGNDNGGTPDFWPLYRLFFGSYIR